MARPNRTRYAVLGALSLRPQTGAEIKKFADRSIGNFWNESYGQIYPILAELVADGLATEEKAPAGRGRPGRVYTITRRGRQELGRWLVKPVEHQVLRVEILLKLFFARQAKLADVEDVVRTFRADHTAFLERWERTERQLSAEHAEAPDLPFWMMTLSYGKHVSEALIAWCDETLATLERLDLSGGAAGDAASYEQ